MLEIQETELRVGTNVWGESMSHVAIPKDKVLVLKVDREAALARIAELTTDDRTEIGCKDAAMWKVEATNWRTEAEAAKEHLTECTEQRDVAWKRIDQLIAERGESVSQGPSIVEYLVAAFDETPASVSQEVDHLAEAKRLMLEVGEPDPLYEHDVAQSHALISIATSLATLAGCVSTIDTSAPHFRTQPHG
jgi:hypothetical protein